MDSDDERNDFFGNDYFDDEPTIAEEAEEVPSDEQVLKRVLEKENEGAARKKIIRNPQPKLNEATMIGPKGIQSLVSSFKGYKPDLFKDPYQNLDVLLKKYENWSHVLFPQLKFDDVISRCETLGGKARVKLYLNRVRLDMPLDDDDDMPSRARGGDIITTDNNEEGVITTRDESDDDAYYDPFETKKETNGGSTASDPQKPAHIGKDDMDAMEQDLLEAEDAARRQFEMEADEMMADFEQSQQ